MAVTGVNQRLKYTETSKVAMHQKAMRTLLGNESRSGKDALFISETAQSFSKQSIAVLIDKSANASAQELSFFTFPITVIWMLFYMPLISVKMFPVDIILISKNMV